MDGPFLMISPDRWARLDSMVSTLSREYARVHRENRQLLRVLKELEEELVKTRETKEELEKRQAVVERFLAHRDRIRDRLDGLLARLELLELPISVASWEPEQ